MAYYSIASQNKVFLPGVGEVHIVEQTVVVNDSDCVNEHGEKNELVGKAFVATLVGDDKLIIETSDTGAFRVNFASVGFFYSADLDAFIPPVPETGSYVFNPETCSWVIIE